MATIVSQFFHCRVLQCAREQDDDHHPSQPHPSFHATTTTNRNNVLLLGDSIAAHALSRLCNLGQHILSGQIASSDDTEADSKAFAIAPEPALGSTDHRSRDNDKPWTER